MRAFRHEDFAGAQRLLEEHWPRIKGAMLLHTRALRSLALETRAAVLLNPPATTAPRRAYKEHSLNAIIQALRKTNRRDAPATADALKAAHARRRGSDQTARSYLARALALYQAAEMRERACVVAWRLAILTADDSERARQEDAAAKLGIRDLAQWARFRAPGLE
jgi:hypothetical protein